MKTPFKCEETRPDSAAQDGSQRLKIGGLAGWLLGRMGSGSRRRPALVVRERITLGPRQTLSLVEAEGRTLLIATSPEGTPAFYALDERRGSRSESRNHPARTSW
jgi:flagellar biogenesis protein FliO